MFQWSNSVPSSQHSKAIRAADPEQMGEKIEEGKQTGSSWAKTVDTHASGVCACACVSSGRPVWRELVSIKQRAATKLMWKSLLGSTLETGQWGVVFTSPQSSGQTVHVTHDKRMTPWLTNTDTEQRQKQIIASLATMETFQSLSTAPVKRLHTPCPFDGFSFLFSTFYITEVHWGLQNYGWRHIEIHSGQE